MHIITSAEPPSNGEAYVFTTVGLLVWNKVEQFRDVPFNPLKIFFKFSGGIRVC